jgi:hypothetical protein
MVRFRTVLSYFWGRKLQRCDLQKGALKQVDKLMVVDRNGRRSALLGRLCPIPMSLRTIPLELMARVLDDALATDVVIFGGPHGDLAITQNFSATIAA